MEIYYEGSAGRETLEIKKTTDFYPAVAKKIAKQEKGKRLQVTAGIDDAHYVMYDVGIRSGTQNITPITDTMPDEYKPVRRKERYLACIDREKNSYKYYRMTPNKNDTFTATYGRCAVDAGQLFGQRSCNWSAEMFDIKLQEKLKKGYVDISKYMLAKDDTELSEKVVKNRAKNANSDLYDLLHGSARTIARQEIHVPVNRTLLEKSKELIDELRVNAKENDLDAFNETLSLLLIIMQRKISVGDGMGVERMMAHSSSDFGRIIQREKDLCEVMEGSLTGEHTVHGDFSDYGVEVFDARPDQISFVEKHLNDSLKPRLKHVWRVIPKGQKDQFDRYVKQNDIKNVKCFWHGSKNENWASIIQNGLKLNPDAVITGKMFGQGIYFAPSAMKSWGYTSFRGSRWANGSDSMAFMGLYATAYGHPYEISSWSGSSDYRRIVLNGPYNCCHAHAAPGFLYNDEVIYYQEDAMELQYIAQFA